MSLMRSIGQRTPLVFAILLGILLSGYALGGRGFAHHTGIHPVYLSEVLLLVGLVAIVLSRRSISIHHTVWLLLIFIAYSVVHTAFYLGSHGLEAARDAVIWLYAVVALAVALTLRQEHLSQITRFYKWGVPVLLIWAVVASFIRRNYQDSVPGLPYADVGITYFKAGDFAVHITAIAGFVILGLTSVRWREIDWRWHVPIWVLWALATFVVLNSRAAMLTILFGVLFAQLMYVLRPPGGTRQIAPLVLPWLALGTLLTLSSVLGIQYETSSGDVKVDGEYVVNSVATTFGVTTIGDPDASSPPGPEEADDEESRDDDTSVSSDEVGSDLVFDRTSQRQLNTREWRLSWWRTIADYTIRGEYFWTGKGFGVNLADSDGFVLDQDPPLRSPHNIHMTFLARMGVPGLVAWIVLQSVFALAVFRVFMRQSNTVTGNWLQSAAGFVLVFWFAVMINSSFDVYLEGPQGGIWFWSVFGLGLALIGFDQNMKRLASE